MPHPSRLGRYAVRRRLGAGGFATVWLAYDEHLDSPVAIKVLADNWTEDHHVRRRFVEEGRFLRKVESPHVVPVYDAGELEDGRPYLVMGYADQGTLADRLEVGGLTVAQALEVVREVGDGLTALHERGLLHRDVKPANVLFRTVDPRAGSDESEPRVRAMLADLGLGKELDVSSRLTMIAGTPSYVAPEQARGEHLDPRADQYSLAALTHLLLAGVPPYRHASLAAAAEPGPPPTLSTPDRRFPPAVEDVVRRGLAADRDDRWPDVASYVSALERALGDEAAPPPPGEWLAPDPLLTQPGARPTPEPQLGPLPEPVPPARRRRGPVLATAAAVLALAAGVVAGYLVESGEDPDVTVTDERGSLEVTVPHDWAGVVSRSGWQPPNGEGADFPAVSVGSAGDWRDPDVDGQGVFVGVLPGFEVPEDLPQHPECASADSPVTEGGDQPSTTIVHADCPSGVTVERVVQVAANRLLWVQVRSADRAAANQVLDSVTTHGF
ncbi:serine/threonine-protein kinase [Nocardioides taihuensis]|uniref:non-specific serine/threonine protein kinase n=1 Tax=Nocardioides taihuensis TaxID=1835606 RepID=A0ABW0BH02_9ACTN